MKAVGPMRPEASSAVIRARMTKVRQRDTSCERAIRSAVHRKGLRYRVNWPLPGTRSRADLAFTAYRVAVFVDGCFWHGCPVHGTWPKANARWWRAKILANKARDVETNRKAQRAGWRVLRFWEHDDPERAATRIARTVRAARCRQPRDGSCSSPAEGARRGARRRD